jgi:hypothetical protein
MEHFFLNQVLLNLKLQSKEIACFLHPVAKIQTNSFFWAPFAASWAILRQVIQSSGSETADGLEQETQKRSFVLKCSICKKW